MIGIYVIEMCDITIQSFAFTALHIPEFDRPSCSKAWRLFHVLLLKMPDINYP